MLFDNDAFEDINQSINNILVDKKNINNWPRIVAATKQQPAEAIHAAIAEGLQYFGENKVQEAEEKWPAIKAAHPGVVLQMIGGLQSNKAQAAVSLFDEIITVDRESLARALRKAMDQQGREISLMIQVNVGEEMQKGGVMPAEADRFIEYCRDELKLPIIGLMCVPPANQYPAPYFALLATIASRHGLKRLSMGMSSDYKTAIRMGATEVRLGTVLFGRRL